MNYREKFFRMIDEMGISARELAKKAQVKECQISLFRNGKANLRVDTFFALIDAADSIRPGAKKYFAMQYSEDFNSSNLVESLSNEQLGDLLIKAASRIKSIDKIPLRHEKPAPIELSHAC